MKVAIIGAGICSLYLAWKLSKNGHEVTVLEKKEKIGKEICSGLVSERVLDFIPESKNLIQNEISHCLIHFPKKTLKIEFSNPRGCRPQFEGGAYRTGKFFVMSHFELDNLVAALATKAGAKIITNSHCSISDIEHLREEFERIIGSDGAFSKVRKFLNLKDPQFYLGIQGFLSERSISPFVETWPTKSGFLWKIPRGKEIEYGIIERPENAKKLFEEFLRRKEIQLEKINPVEEFRQDFLKENLNSRSESKFLYGVNSAIVPQGLIIPKDPKITLCGDAVGLTKPWSGGGIIWGLTAVNLLLKNFPDFIKYQKEARRFFLPKIIFSKMAKRIIYFSGFNLPWFLPQRFKIESDFLM